MEPIREWVVVLWLVFVPAGQPQVEAVIDIYRGDRAMAACTRQKNRHRRALQRTGRTMVCAWLHAKIGEDNE